jgi:TP901 family phage tail tape measure protein
MAEEIQSNIRVNIDTAGALAGLKLLQREISAFHTQMSKAGAASAATSAQMGSNLVNTINQTGKFAASMTTVKTSAQAFTTALEKNQLSMGQYFRYAAGASKSFGKQFATEFNTIQNVAIERVKSLQTQYIKMGTAANGAITAIKVRPLTLDMENLGTRTMIAAQRQQLLNQMLDLGSTKLLNFGKNMQWAGRQLMVGFTVPLTMFAASAMNSYKQIEAERVQLTRVYGTFETTAAEANRAADSVQKLANQYTAYGLAVKDTMALGATVAAAGATGKDLTEQVAASSKLAVLGRMSQDEAFKSIMVLKNAFHLSGKGLENTIGLMNATQNQTVNSIQDITEATIKAGPVVQALGGDMSDLLFFTTAMREGGISASQGANALKSALASMINPTAKAAGVLKGMGIDLNGIVQKDQGNLRATVMDFGQALDKLDPLKRAQALETLFGKFQFARVSALFNNINRAGSQASAVAGLGNASSKQLQDLMDREMKKVSDSPLYKFQKQLADFQAAMAPIGEQFMKFLTPVMKFFTDLAKGFQNLPDGMKQAIVGISVILGGVAPLVLMLVGLISNGAANMMKFLVTIKKFFNGLTSGSQILGEQVRYMSTAEIDAAAEAASLDQIHQKLVQTFTVEAEAVDLLAAAYERAAFAARSFGPMPGMASAAAAEAAVIKGYSASSRNAIRGIQGYAEGGILKGPGTGTSDSMVARVSTGEAIIPAASVKKNPDVVNALISGDMPGYAGGYTPAFVSTYKSEAKLAYEAEQRRLAEDPARLQKIAAQRKAKMPKLFLYDPTVAGILDENSPVAHKMIIDQNLGKIGFTTLKNDIQFTQDKDHVLLRGMGLRANRWRTVKPGDTSWLGKYFDVNEYGPLGTIIRRFADGGIVNGPGTGKSDSVVARVSNGEAIIPAESVKKNPDVVNALVSGNMPAYSTGLGTAQKSADAWVQAPGRAEMGHFGSSVTDTGANLQAKAALDGNLAEVNQLITQYAQKVGISFQQALETSMTMYTNEVIVMSGKLNNAIKETSGSMDVSEVRAEFERAGAQTHGYAVSVLTEMKQDPEKIVEIVEKLQLALDTELGKFASGTQIASEELSAAIQAAYTSVATEEEALATAFAEMKLMKGVAIPRAEGAAGSPTRIGASSQTGEDYGRAFYKNGGRVPGVEGDNAKFINATKPYFPEEEPAFTAVAKRKMPRADKEMLQQLPPASQDKLIEMQNNEARSIEIEKEILDRKLMTEEQILALRQKYSTVATEVEQIEAGAKASLDIQSPSKKLEIVGEQAGDGLLIGVEKGLQPITEAATEMTTTLEANTMSWSEWKAAVASSSASLDIAAADQLLYEEIMKQMSTAIRTTIPVAETLDEKLQLLSLAGGEFGEMALKASAQIERGGSGIELGTNMATKAFDEYVVKMQAQALAEEELASMATLDAEALQAFIAEFGAFNPMITAMRTGTSQAMSRAKEANDPGMYQTVGRRGEELKAYAYNNAPFDEMDESPRAQAPKFTQALPSSQEPVVAAAQGTVATFAETVQTESKVVMPTAGGIVVEEMVTAVEASLPEISVAAETLVAAMSEPIVASVPEIQAISNGMSLSISEPLKVAAAEVQSFGTYSQGTMQHVTEQISKMLNGISENGVISIENLNKAYLKNVELVNGAITAEDIRNINLREGVQLLELANAPMNMLYGAIEKIGAASEQILPMLTSAGERLQIEFIKVSNSLEQLATAGIATATKFGVAAKEMAITAGTAVKNAAVATGTYLTTAQPNRISQSLRTKQANLRGDNGAEAQAGARGGGGKGMMATMGLMMVTGMLSGVKGPLGDFANFLQPVLMGLSVMSMILPLLTAEQTAAMIGLGAAMMEFIVPIMAVIAVIGLLVLAFNLVADQAKKDAEKTAAANRKAADAIVGFGSALGASKDQIQNFNDTFQTNLGGSAMTESHIATTGSGYHPVVQTNEDLQKTNQLVGDENFKSANSNLIDQLKKAKGAQGNVLINSFAQTLKSQGAADKDISLYVEALKKSASRQDLQLDFKTLDIGSKLGQAQMEEQIKNSVKQFTRLSKIYSPEVLAQGEQLSSNASSVHGLSAKSYVSKIKKIGTGEDTADARNAYRDQILNQLKENTDFQQYMASYSAPIAGSGGAFGLNGAKKRTVDENIAIFKKNSAGQDNNENSDFAKMITAVSGSSNANLKAFTDSGKMSAGDLQIMSTQAQMSATDITNLGTAFKNGQVNVHDFNKDMKMIGDTISTLGAAKGNNYINSIVDSMKDLDTGTKTAIKGLSVMGDKMLLIKAASLGINIDPEVVKAISAGEAAQQQLKNNPNMTGQGATILANQVAAMESAKGGLTQSITDMMNATAKAAEAAKTPLDKINEKYQKQKDLLDAESTLLGKVQSKIEAAYKKRIDALNTISKINETIAQSQRDQLSLATALSQGDIAQAAAAAQTMRANNAKNAIEQQGAALQAQSDRAVAAATITYKGKKLNQAQIDAAKEKADTANLLANNSGLGYSTGGYVAGYAAGGMVAPKYFVNGDLAKGTDIIPAMLTPGEFVMTKSTVDRIGASNLSAINSGGSINSGSEGEGSVYNYSVNVNVATGANPEQIANAVIKKVERLNSQNLRGNTYGA